jgi:glycerate 2-kinase
LVQLLGAGCHMTSDENARADLVRIFRAALDAVAPDQLSAAALRGELSGAEIVPEFVASAKRIFVLAVGKAASRMMAAAEQQLGGRISDAVAVVPAADLEQNHTGTRIARFFPGGHPLPDADSVGAAQASLAMLAGLDADDMLLVLLSGGASAMIVAPADPVTLEDKIAVNAALLRVRASINEINAVRKHLSAIKGGRLLRHCNGARVLSLILSDVRGNDLATIGSGPTAADHTTFEDARAVLIRHSLWGRTPERVREYLEAGAAGEFDETVKAGDPVLQRVTNIICGDNVRALAAADVAARALGYQVDRWRELYGEAADLGRTLAAHLSALSGERRCVLTGGEPVVTVRGGGKGGRAQELALSLAIELDRLAPQAPIAALCAATDGVDGPTDAAGAFATPSTVARARAANLNPQQHLARNNSYALLKACGDLFQTGPTGTNVTDIFVALVNY